MLPSRQTPDFEKQYRALQKAEDREVTRLLRPVTRWERFFKKATVALTVANVAIAAYQLDVWENETIRASAEMGIEVRGEALNTNNDDAALVFLDGFGTYDADVTTDHLGPAVQQAFDGELWSVSYGNAPLSARRISEHIIQLAEERAIDRVSLAGYSAGGCVATKTAEYLMESDLQVEGITMISTPDGRETLRPYSLGELNSLGFVADIPGAMYSTPGRAAGELYIRRDQYVSDGLFHPAEFVQTLGDVIHDVNDEKTAGTWLLVDQALAIENCNLEERMTAIAAASPDHQEPIFLYLGTDKPGYDYMVNDDDAARNIGLYALRNRLEFFTADVPGAVHTQPWKANDEYIAAVAALAPELRAELAEETALYQAAHTRTYTEGNAKTILASE
jgi:pimeloyl-ACP methyl ester carboxylesterase